VFLSSQLTKFDFTGSLKSAQLIGDVSSAGAIKFMSWLALRGSSIP
jgi:hypothetical protein